MKEKEIEYLFAKMHSMDIVLMAVCAQLDASKASGALGLIQKMTSNVAHLPVPNGNVENVMLLISQELLRYQRVLLAQTSAGVPPINRE
ncbi:hypothetical protein PQR63_19415 [Herbaspirillum rhizosphaerae]|uniref:Uncharacterized protein n=2 Tax=Herbaspirillum TaxID=963 RepID=A0ABW8ZF69_9BURK